MRRQIATFAKLPRGPSPGAGRRRARDNDSQSQGNAKGRACGAIRARPRAGRDENDFPSRGCIDERFLCLRPVDPQSGGRSCRKSQGARSIAAGRDILKTTRPISSCSIGPERRGQHDRAAPDRRHLLPPDKRRRAPNKFPVPPAGLFRARAGELVR